MIAGLRDRVVRWVLDPNPILVKELRATFRTAMFVRFLYLSTAVIAFIVLGMGAVVATGNTPPAQVGQVVFHLFFGLALFLICLIAPGYASAAITGERERETWESLAMSGMGPWRIVLGKLAAAYASIALVLVALSPVVGIAFLFGGVAPLQVAFGFLSMLVFLLPAVAFGLAVSAHLRSTRASIGLSTIVYVPIAFFATTLLGGFGEVAHREWGLATEGPFFYTEALATRAAEWDTWALLVVAPLFTFGMIVWFLLASAVSGVRPETEDKSGPLKVWAVAMAASTCLVSVVPLLLLDDATERGKMAVIEGFGVACLLVFFAHVFCNDPPIASRAYERAMAGAPAWRRALRVLGPGAARTLRFGVVLILGTSFGFLVVTGLARRLIDPSHGHHLRWDGSAFAVVVGSAIVAFFALALGGWLRVVVKSALAARVLTFTVLGAGTVLPLLFALVIDPDSTEHLSRRAPLLAHFSAIYPGILSAQIGKDHAELTALLRLAVPLCSYGMVGLALWGFVEARALRAARAQRERMRRFEEEAPRERISILPTRRSGPPAEEEK